MQIICWHFAGFSPTSSQLFSLSVAGQLVRAICNQRITRRVNNVALKLKTHKSMLRVMKTICSCDRLQEREGERESVACVCVCV